MLASHNASDGRGSFLKFAQCMLITTFQTAGLAFTTFHNACKLVTTFQTAGVAVSTSYNASNRARIVHTAGNCSHYPVKNRKMMLIQWH